MIGPVRIEEIFSSLVSQLFLLESSQNFPAAVRKGLVVNIFDNVGLIEESFDCFEGFCHEFVDDLLLRC